MSLKTAGIFPDVCGFPVDFRVLMLVLMGLVTTGCGGPSGPQRVAVKGQVSLDDQPLKSGVIRFIPTGNTSGPAASATIKAGAFATTLKDGPVVGTQKVEIEALDFMGFAADDEAAFAQNVEQKSYHEKPKNPIPPAYNTNTSLTLTIMADGPQQFQFPLRSDGTPVTPRPL